MKNLNYLKNTARNNKKSNFSTLLLTSLLILVMLSTIVIVTMVLFKIELSWYNYVLLPIYNVVYFVSIVLIVRNVVLLEKDDLNDEHDEYDENNT